MNRTLTALKRRAAKAAYDLGHQLYWTLDKDGPHQVLTAVCRRCGLRARCDTSAPSGAALLGDAIRKQCPDPMR